MRSTRGRRLRSDEGAVLVEFVLVAPLLILLVFGLIDYGRMLQDSNVLVRTVQSAARTGAAQGPDRYADYNVIQSIEASLASVQGAEIERVVVFRAHSPDGKVPPACADLVIGDDLTPKGISSGSATTGVRCNVYSRAQVQFRGNVLQHFPPSTTCAGGWDVRWCPTTRSRGSDTSDPDYLGVYVEVRATPLTGVVGLPDQTMSSTSVFRLDPCITGVSCA